MLFGDNLVITMRRFVLHGIAATQMGHYCAATGSLRFDIGRLGYRSPTGDLLAYQGIELLRRAAPALMP
jgi:hypothetical protein